MRLRSSVAAATMALTVLSFVAATAPARAECDPANAIFEDDFEFHDPSWGAPSENVYVEGGTLVVKDGWGQVNFSTRSDEADVCADITIVEAADLNQNPATIIFWWGDWDNYYELMYWATGGYAVDRIRNGNAIRVVPYTETPAIKNGLGQTNNFRIRLKPKDATIFANGTELIRFKGQPPRDGGMIGFRSWGLSKYDNLIVSERFE